MKEQGWESRNWGMKSDLEIREIKETDQERNENPKEGDGGFLPSWAFFSFSFSGIPFLDTLISVFCELLSRFAGTEKKMGRILAFHYSNLNTKFHPEA